MRVLDVRELAQKIDSQNVVTFEKDTYIVERADAFCNHFSFSNTDDLPEQYFGAIIRNKKRGIVIDGKGSTFVFRGPMTPFAIVDSEFVTMKNMTITFDPPLVAEGKVVHVGENYVDLSIDREKFPCECRDNWLYFDIGLRELSPLCRRAQIHFEYDRTVTPGSGDDFVPERVEALGNDLFRVYPNNPVSIRVGEVFVLRHNARTHPGIFIENSRETILENITFHGAGGLGILAQFCYDLTLRGIHFLPGEGMFVANGRDDGFHATTCRGQILIEDCSFVGLMDDPINIHGCMTKLDFVTDGGRVLHGRYMHEQAQGFLHYAENGDELQIIRRDTMEVVKTVVAQEYRLDRRDSFRILLKEAVQLPAGDYAIENISAAPDVIIRRCRFGSCRARGLLVSTPWPVIISDNWFESSGSAILLSGDANNWYESGACRNVRIYRNVFTDRAMSSKYEFCDGIISIAPVVEKPGKPFHQGIWVFENLFDTPRSPIVSAFATKYLQILANKIFLSPSRKNECAKDALVALSWCEDVEIKNNIVIGPETPDIVQENCENVTVTWGKELYDLL